MHFQDEGYIINLRKHGERSLILTVVTKNNGKITGYVKNCLTKKNLGIYQLGNLVTIDAYARLEENMLSLRVELSSPSAVNFMNDSVKLDTLSAFCSLCNACLPENENLERFYYYIDSFFNLINEDNWITHYSYFEFYLLDYLGVGLDLSECSATGSVDNLKYVSPKTGKAVCEEAGLPYKERLFLYPQYIVDKNYHPQASEVVDLLGMMEFFLNKNFFQIHNLKFPINRVNLGVNLREYFKKNNNL